MVIGAPLLFTHLNTGGGVQAIFSFLSEVAHYFIHCVLTRVRGIGDAMPHSFAGTLQTAARVGEQQSRSIRHRPWSLPRAQTRPARGASRETEGRGEEEERFSVCAPLILNDDFIIIITDADAPLE